MANFITHVNTVLRKMRQPPITSLSTDTASRAFVVQEAVNRALARVWNAKQWSFKRRSDTFTTASGTSDYELPKAVGEVITMRSSAYPYNLKVVPKHLYDLYVPNPTATGNPKVAVLSNLVGVSEQPSSASTIGVVSSSSADTTQTVLIKGIVSGQEHAESVTLNGTTTATTSNSFTSVESVTKSAVTTGRITLTAGATTVLVLGPNELTTRLRVVTLYPQPTSALTITIHHFRVPPYLTLATEDTLIPERWDYVIDQWAFALALQSMGQDQTTEFTNQITLASKFLEEDMRREEQISAEEWITALKAGDSGYNANRWGPPSGTEWVVP